MRQPLLVAIPFILVGILATVFLERTRIEKERAYLTQYTQFLSTAYLASVQKYELATDTVFREVVETREVLELFATGAEASGLERARARGALYRMLFPAYQNLVRNDVQQFHFVLPDGTSYLRMHQPDRAEDDIFSDRPSLRFALEERRPTTGFEAGRLLSGFRFVYPVELRGALLGAVDISVSFEVIRDSMAALDPTRNYAFVLRRTAVEPILFDEQRHLYRESSINPDYWVEDPVPGSGRTTPTQDPSITEVNEGLYQDPRVRRRMAEDRPFTVDTKAQGQDYVVSFVPVGDLTGATQGYVISYTRTGILSGYRQEFNIALAALIGVLIGTYVLVMRLLRQREALAREQEQLVLITQTMADGLYVLDQNGQTSFINGPGAETLGFDAEELLGKPIHDLVHAHAKNDNIPLEKCPIFAAALTGVEYEGEEIFLNKQGQDFQVEVAARPLKLHNQLVGVVTLFRDITQRKAREQEREALIAALRRSNAEIARLAEITAHHLQEPVRRLATYSQMVRRRLQSEPGSAGRLSGDGVGLADIEAEALRTRDLLHDIQTYIEAGEAPKAAPMIDLNAAVRMVLDSRSAVMKDIDVETVVQDLPSIPFDPARLRRVFSILIDNALQHRDPDRPLRIGVSAQETGDRVTVVVDDTGPGIPEAYRERVFRLFERLYPESRPAGTGTGLSIVRRLMECAGGSVRIAESPSGGTRVFLDFPAKAPLRLEGLPIASGEMADPKAPSEPAMPREMPELTTLQKRDAALLSLNKEILESAGEGIYGVDAVGMITFINPAACAMLGYDHEDLLGAPAHVTFHHHHADGSHHHVSDCPTTKAIRTGVLSRIEGDVFWTRDNMPITVDYVATPIRDEHSAVTGAVVVFRDVTEVLEQRATLQKLSQAVENSPAPIMITDREGAIEYVNQGFEVVTGYNRDEVMGRNPRFLNAGNMSEDAYRDLWQTITAGQAWSGEFENQRKDGSLFWELATITPVMDANGTVMSFVAVNEDITERKEMEDMLRESNDELEHFAYTVSHDLRQPLRMVISFSQLMERELGQDLSPALTDYLAFVQQGAQRMDQMLSALLEYSRIGRVGEPMERVNAGELVQEAIKFLGPTIKERHALITLPDQWPTITASRNEGVRLFQNLLGNALKYCPPDRAPEITVTVTSDADQGGHVFRIEDNGIGMDPSQMGQLFRVFRRLHLNDEYEGTGIGLAVSRRIMERHGGQIRAESEGEGKGSTFVVVFPA